MSRLTVIVTPPDADGVASATIAARAAGGAVEMLFFESERLAAFFEGGVQDKLPALYRLIVCGLEVVHTNWDAEVIRPRLMDSLRGFVSPLQWFSARDWRAEDRAAVQNIVGEGNLVVRPGAACTASLVRDGLAQPGDAFANLLVKFAEGSLAAEEEERWGWPWRRVIASLRGAPARLREAIAPLVEGSPEQIAADLVETADRVERECRSFAADNAAESVPVGERELVVIAIPRARHAFWPEISSYARAGTGADFCLCVLTGRPVMILSRGPEQRADLRTWVRYLTDMLPGATTVGAGPEAVPIVAAALKQDAGLVQEAVRTLRQGAHLLAG